ncbi:MAG: ATP synthase F0 subunit B [Candidatus Sungbacteria bacterium RIFCSPLOWO2_02_FULL_54_10]|uniref:ATP synthase subunit b n=2 Tax=Candidatus Sungiibacteriota TaxID=1817917 RepID=A0A1G2L6T5_9BACT|nr:MAG: ATP synthase F0 subunit B [Candidatus Sungbacteria bacterium RIFCSPHIGHO2_01_FULL_54_26]OHA07363.1 MAG: ATP synthase F0 subunit B [Candidatus Sungbacteria bacterium RIFCSPLOWO2_01_FULL_54_21]OHA12704.1 MAG: ATP synthase F0 subunit B [Candidatus Sungbacteria bacterium RIFCSPLOWO2_02_FULL_54_10]
MEELIRHFGIDWRMLLAQAVNFGVLLFILWKFAYRPILGVLHERREGIERGLALTRNAEKRMADIAVLQEEKLSAAQQTALAIVSRAEAVAKEQRELLIAEAGKRGEHMITEAKRVIMEEKGKLREELKHEARELIRDGIAAALMKMPPTARDRELIDAAVAAMKK